MVSEQDRLRREYVRWVEIKAKTFGVSNEYRIENIEEILKDNPVEINGVPVKPLAQNSPFRHFLNWVKENDGAIDTAMIWGSYLKGIETERSFSMPKPGEVCGAEIMLGPSDINALVVSTEDLRRPVLLRQYVGYDKHFNEVGRVERDVYREVEIFSLDSFHKKLGLKKPLGRSYLLCAFFELGMVLKSSNKVAKIFEGAKKSEPNYYDVTREYFDKKIQNFRAVLK